MSDLPRHPKDAGPSIACTWEGCAKVGAFPQNDRDGRTWSVLCAEHVAEFDEAIGRDVAAMMRCWVKAQGGANKASRRMTRCEVRKVEPA